MILSGRNLGERQKDLNYKVNDAVTREINFNIILKQKEVSDVDVLFKIDIAANYKQFEYILEILKSEDTLHITRALKKCHWLFDDEHSHIIDIYYLHHNIFPHMSPKMKRKMLTTISKHVRDENQAETFYNYCKTEKLENVATKFIFYTSETFKLNYIKKWDGLEERFSNKVKIKFFLGNSFALAEAYLKKGGKSKADDTLSKISYLYYISNEKYLDLLEKYATTFSFPRLSTKVTKDIAKKYKNRVLAKLDIYLPKLHMNTLVKYSNLEENKQYAIALIAKTSERFWLNKHWKTNKVLLNTIPYKERFEFVKSIFTKMNPGKRFETSDDFWTEGYFNIMTKEQKIEATKNYANEQGNIGRIKRNIWYKSVKFNKAFSTFEENMANNKNRRMRINLLIVLIKASKSQQDLLKVLRYYQAIYNEDKFENKEMFINAIILHQEVFNLDVDCWQALQRMMLDEKVRKVHPWPEKKYESIVYLYLILHNKEFPADYKSFLDKTPLSSFKDGLNLMDEKQRTRVMEYLYQHHVNRLYELDDAEYDFDKKLKYQINLHVHSIINLIFGMDKSKDDIPEIAQKYILSDWKTFQHYDELKDNENFVKRLKEDASTVQHFRTLKAKLEEDIGFNLLPVLKKIKIYFSHDIAKQYLDFFEYCLSERNLETLDEYGASNQHQVVKTAIIGIYMLAEDSHKQEIMFHFKPTTDSIDYEEIDRLYLEIQESICKFAFYSRPPMPFSRLEIYLKGDYARYCLPTVGALFANLATPSCIQLAETILSTPDSMLKYSFHLVLHRLSVEDLQEVVTKVLKNTEHDSVRLDLFALVFRATISHTICKNIQQKLLVCFKEMASTVPEYDVQCYNTLQKMNVPNYVDESVRHELLEVYQMWAPEEGI